MEDRNSGNSADTTISPDLLRILLHLSGALVSLKLAVHEMRMRLPVEGRNEIDAALQKSTDDFAEYLRLIKPDAERAGL